MTVCHRDQEPPVGPPDEIRLRPGAGVAFGHHAGRTGGPARACGPTRPGRGPYSHLAHGRVFVVCDLALALDVTEIKVSPYG